MSDESRLLLERLRDGNSQAATEVFNRYALRLIALARTQISPRLARRTDPEDIVQSAYRSFFRRVSDDDIILRRAGDLWRLLAAFTINKLRAQIEYHTAQRRNWDLEVDASGEHGIELNEAGVTEPTVEQVAMLTDELAEVMRRIQPRERTVLEGRLQGRTIEEISAGLKCSQRTVRRLLQRSREVLEARLLNASRR